MAEYFPTIFAIKISRHVKLYPKKDVMDYYYDAEGQKGKTKKLGKKMVDLHERLVEFQNLSIGTDFKSALLSYEGMRLTESQIEVLEKIHESTYDWVKGRLVDKVLTSINESSNSKEIKELSEVMIALMGGESSSSSMVGKKISAFVINT